jgi:hypothetical protein
VTYADQFPGEERLGMIEGDAAPAAIRTLANGVATNFFDLLGVHLLAGRGFTAADATAGASAVIVDETFAQELAGGANVLGRRIRFASRTPADAPNPWYEIVGVVPAFVYSIAPPVGIGSPTPRLYRAAKPGDTLRPAIIIQTNGGDPNRLTQRLREVSVSVHPTLKLDGLIGVVQDFDHGRAVFRYISLGILAVISSVLLLSAAGIYAMMSFTVAKRRREIGIRAALGADARRVLIGIFGRASAQIGAGVAAGLGVAAALQWLGTDIMGRRGFIFFPPVAAIMFVVGVLAALGPARRGLAVQPTEALRDE